MQEPQHVRQNDLALARAGEQMTVAPRPAPAVGDMLAAVIEKGVTAENVAAVEQIVKLYERMQERDAERAFATAFVDLQSEMPKIQAVRPVPNKDGSIRYKFAPFEDIMREVAPLLQKHGFTVSFSSDCKEDRMFQECTIQHVGGHKRTNSFAVRVGQGPPGATATQADGAASTYAKRFALCDALNIVISHLDDDARADGPTGAITEAQAFELERRVAETNSDVLKFLKLAGSKTFAEIPQAKFGMLDELLRRKEKVGR